jgi:transcriptional regulator with XRE-family HTH domain
MRLCLAGVARRAGWPTRLHRRSDQLVSLHPRTIGPGWFISQSSMMDRRAKQTVYVGTMIDPLATSVLPVHGSPVMLTGDQIAAARRLAGIRTQADLATAAGVSRPTVERAERAKGEIPGMGTGAMRKIIQALEAAGVTFHLEGGSLAGNVGMRRRLEAEREMIVPRRSAALTGDADNE